LAAIQTLQIKKRGGEEGGEDVGKGENSALTSQCASVECGIEKQGMLEAEEEGGLCECTLKVTALMDRLYGV